ncbi:rhodanese-like domain-containing protein [Amycolatopsis granulosa]|uniref:rhodanese-like domain-containing protein n=1 Tax=Amycolatopsis granulosa TaxID=185684 RepID=UPI0014202D8E|nr:rhodanese-like domain-containing protein [Amycolatopsis granulosa]NIH86044.1 thiosulfate/3-mercaptopyruvate sulfurtransferase [Amycolatopsis granulosa]
MRYVIVGAGAVGSTVAAQLHLAGIPVVLIARGEHGARIRRDGLRYFRPSGEQLVRVPVAASAEEVELAADDVLVVATKTQNTEEVLQEWSWRQAGSGVAADLPVVMLQNGLENERAALRRFATVFGASLWMPTSYVEPGEVCAQGAEQPGILWLGQFPSGDDPRLTAIAADLRAADFGVQIVPDLLRWKAGKLLANLGNAVDALFGREERTRRLGKELRNEGRRVLAAAGIDPVDLREASEIDTSVADPAPIPGRPRVGSSTRQSLARGTGSVEGDFLNGEIVLLGRLHGVPTPLNAALQRRLALAAARGEAPGSADLADIDLPRPPVLISADELQRQLGSAAPPVLLDVRWALGDPNGHRHYLDGHLPGAVYVDLDTELAGPPSPADGRHPLPDIEALQAAARRWGIREDSSVVAYDNSGNLAAARAWWLLRWAGVADVRLLDGGLAGWGDRPLETGFGRPPEPGDVVLKPGHLPVLSIDEAAVLPARGTLLDARAGERYRGEQEPVDPRAGHIPGAVSAPTGDNLAADGRFRSPAELGARFRELGAADGPVAVYCGSGVTASHEIAALAVAGIDAALYPGSWSQWSNQPDRPAATGPNP